MSSGNATESGHDQDPVRSEPDRNDMSHRIDRWIMRILGFAILLGLVAVVSYYAAKQGDESSTTASADTLAAGDAEGSASYKPEEDLTALAEVKVPNSEQFKRADPTLPPIPSGAVKKFKVEVYEHVTKVSDDFPPTRVWSYAVNGQFNRGNGVSAPMVVEQGDRVEMTLFNGSSEAMQVRVPHSIDFHSSELNPETAFRTIAPGEKTTLEFTGKHPGVFMYHCATQPVLQHTGSGMVGMMIVKPRNLPPAEHEFWINQQEYYIGEPGGDGDLEKMEAKDPDVIAFNGYAAQYQEAPIEVGQGERVRVYVLNSGPSIWSAFHVIGTVFDRTQIEGVEGRHAQTVNLAPSQGGIVEFTLDREGAYPFVTHAFGDTVKGAIGRAGDGPRQIRPRHRPGSGRRCRRRRDDGRDVRRDQRAGGQRR
jgi:nitrite reductase (NO-forming)